MSEQKDLESLAAAAGQTAFARSRKHTAPRKSGSAAAAGCLIVFGAVAIGAMVIMSGEEKNSDSSREPGERIAYEIVDEWNIPNGGYGRVVVVDPAYRNDVGLRRLARQIKEDTSEDRNAFVFIYDDRSAAALRKSAIEGSLSEAEVARHDTHMIASYTRNGNTGHHALTITLQGAMGPAEVIKQ